MHKQWSLMSPLELFQGDDTLRRCKIMNLINKHILTAPLTSCSSSSLPLLGSPYFLMHNIEIRPNNSPTMPSKRSSERKSCGSLTLNQKLEMIALNDKGMPTAKPGQKLGLFC